MSASRDLSQKVTFLFPKQNETKKNQTQIIQTSSAVAVEKPATSSRVIKSKQAPQKDRLAPSHF